MGKEPEGQDGSNAQAPEVRRTPGVEQERRQATVYLPGYAIVALLGLPDGLRVLWCRGDDLRGGLTVLVEGDGLAPVPPDAEPPPLGGLSLCQEWVEIAGKRFWRLAGVAPDRETFGEVAP